MAKSKDTTRKQTIGYMMYGVAVFMPLTNAPQIIQLYSTKVATGLTISTWVMYLIFGLVPLAYALANKLRPLIISNILWTIIDLIMIYGIIRYSPNLLPDEYGSLLVINNIGKALNGLGLLFVSIAFALFTSDFIGNSKRARK